MDLRRRARRRLVGAIALALVAVVLLPLLFDPEPRPLGSDVDIRIPEPAAPFQPPPALVEVPPETPPATAPAKVDKPVAPAPRVPPPPPPRKEAPSSTQAPAKVPANAPAKAPVAGAAVMPEAAPAEKPPKAASRPFTTEGYFLQVGVFGNEANARQLAQQLETAGFRPDVYTTNAQTRVRVGPYSERLDALDVQRKLKAKGFNTVLLGP